MIFVNYAILFKTLSNVFFSWAHQSKLIKKQKGGNIQQRTTRVDETRDEFEHLLKKKNHEDDEPTTESKWSALQGGNEAGEEDDWMD